MINRVVLVGRLTKDVEVRKTQSGLSVAQFTVACDRNGKKAEGQPDADFISCVAWRQPADFLGQYARKGALIGVDGRLQSRSYDRDGQRVYVTEVVADNVRLLESRAQSESKGSRTQADAQTQTQAATAQETQTGFETGSPLDINSDDLPF